ncbi:MAG: biotin synthase BioB [Candidatus Binatia bacterium]
MSEVDGSANGRFLEAVVQASLAGSPPSREAARRLLDWSDEELPELLWGAFRVRAARWGRRVKICVLQNARSGLCPEDCHYCSQSAVSTAEIDRYRLRSTAALVEGARRAAAQGARRYCMVTSGRGPSEADIGHLCRATREIKAGLPHMEVCVSLGIMSETQARELRAAGVGWVNHNLNTSERFHSRICSTHTYADRVRTVRSARAAGLAICSGGILGMGEADDDVVDLAFALRELEVDSLPVNFLHPIDGTPLEGAGFLDPVKALKALCLFRFTNPAADIRAAGGRERNLGAWQSLVLYPANSIFVQGYLTTPGQTPREAERMIADMGFEIEAEVEEANGAAPA